MYHLPTSGLHNKSPVALHYVSNLAHFVATKNILQMTPYLVFLQMSLVVKCFRTLGTLERLFSSVSPTNFIQGQV